MSNVSKFSHIEVDNKIYSIERAFVLTIIDQNPDEKFCGLNIAIVLPCNEDGCHEIEKMDFLNCFNIVLCDNDGLRIPIEIHGEDKYNSAYNYGYDKKTICIFGYINPLMFDKRK